MQAITNILNFSGRSIFTIFRDFHYTTANHMHSYLQFKTNAMNYVYTQLLDNHIKWETIKKSEKVYFHRERTEEFLPSKTK